jgi:hypothetical protein
MDTILAFVSILSLALSVGGLIPVFFLRAQKKVIVISLGMVLLVLVALSTISIVRIQDQTTLIERQSNEVLERLEIGSKTFDQLYQELFYPDFKVLSQAIDNLVSKGKVGHTLLDVHDERGEIYRIRIYYRKVQ